MKDEILICDKCGFMGTSSKKESEEKHRKYIKEHEPVYVTKSVYFGEDK
ncbi:hypothetical protein SEA_MILDRED21_189 [Streptomyces phage Mildred21]|uniref:Uncharacterized protein n=1 Tax=Streptomyces phage Mildred21 TaxID=2023959 RepID=A0A222YU98_9CAUD|nr:hypothetical protein FDI35_gp124 [Streptomyces phage Mildred21]ASR75554.1 hypothetical protein SEA_MILDRED21_189 [Streptomyces phage Mildred21]